MDGGKPILKNKMLSYNLALSNFSTNKNYTPFSFCLPRKSVRSNSFIYMNFSWVKLIRGEKGTKQDKYSKFEGKMMNLNNYLYTKKYTVNSK